MGFVRVEPGEVVVAGSQLRAPTLVGVRWPTIRAFAADSISRQACSVVAVLTSFYALLASKQTTAFEALAATAAGCGQNYGQMEASITSALSNTESGLTPGAAPGIAVPAAPHTQQIIGLPGTAGELDACTQAGSVVSNGPVFFETSCEQFSENLHTMLDNNAQNWGHSYKNAASQLDDYTHATTQALATIAEFWFGAAAAAATGTISLHRVNAQVLAATVVQLAAGADACWQAYLACCKTCPTPYEFRQAHQDIQVLGQHLATSPNPVVEAQYLQAVEHLCQLYTRTAAAAATYETAISAVLGGESATTTTAAATTASDVPTSPPDQIMGPHTSPHITTADNTSRNGSTQTVDQQTGGTDGDGDPDSPTSDNDNTRKTPDHDPVVGGYDICVALVEHLGYSSKKTVYWVANTGPDSKYIPPGGYIPRTRYGQLAYHITNHDGPASVLSDIGVYDGWIHPADTMLAWWRQQNKHIRLRAIVSIKPMPQDTFNAFARIGNVSIYSGYQPEPADNVALPFTGPNNTPFAPENIPGYTKNRSGPWDSRLCVQEPNLYRKEADFTSSSHLPKSLRVLREEWEMTFPRAQPTTRDIFVDPNMYETARTLTHQHLDYDEIANKDRWHATHATQHDTRRRGRCDGDNPHDLNQRCLYLNAFLNFSVAETLLLGCAHDDRLRMRPTDIITDTGTPDRNITQIRRDTCTGCLQTRQTWETLNTIAPTDYQPLPSEPTR